MTQLWQKFSARIPKIVTGAKQRYLLWRSGLNSWETYLHMTDPDISWRAGTIDEYYHGYPHVYQFSNRTHPIYHWEIHTNGLYVINNWCSHNIKHKYRFDAHRVTKDRHSDRYLFDEMGGSDYYYVAFKDAEDFAWFMMRWG